MPAETRAILLRGVNVGGANRMPMAGLRALLGDLGLGSPQTYIASGNAVVESKLPCAVIEGQVASAIAARFGFAPSLHVLTRSEMELAALDHPFGAFDPARVHVFFLRGAPPPLDQAAMRELAEPGDAWTLAPGRFTLFTPAGIGRSKLTQRMPRWLPGDMTARNLNTVRAVLAMMSAGR